MMSIPLEIALIVFIIVMIVLAILAYNKIGNFLDSLKAETNKLTGTIEKLAVDITEVKDIIIDLTNATDKVLVKANDIVDEVKVQTIKLNQSIDPFVGMINSFYNRVAPPVQQTAGILSAATKAINHFFTKIVK